MTQDSQNSICSRIAAIRVETEGARGKANFAKKLGLPASTYDYYESQRVPPADVLVKIADLANVDLRWLMTGQSGPQAVPANHPSVVRVAQLLANHPDAAAPLAAFVELLAGSMGFPAKEQDSHAPQATAAAQPDAAPGKQAAAVARPTQEPSAFPSASLSAAAGEAQADNANWIAVLGRSAAGLPQFWSESSGAQDVTTLAQLVARNTARTQRSAVATADKGDDEQDAVQLITLSEPDSDNIAEFISAPRIKARYRDAFAVRIDGESMSPDIRHGDFVILSPSTPACDGKPAVVQIQGQIGVTCKLYRQATAHIHLVPINEQYPPQLFPANKIVWALRVLAKIRP